MSPKDYLDALSELHVRVQKTRSSAKRTMYRDRKKVQDAFVAGGWSSDLAHLLAVRVQKLDGAADATKLGSNTEWGTVDFSKPWLFVAGDSGHGDAQEPFLNVPSAATPQTMKVAQELKQDHKGGIRMALVSGMDGLAGFGDDKKLPSGPPDLPTTPWCLCVGRHAYRVGPFAWPFLGCSCALRSAEGVAFIVLVDVGTANDAGLQSLDALKEWLASAQKDALSTVVTVARLAPGDVLYISFGQVALPTTTDDFAILVVDHVWQATEKVVVDATSSHLVGTHVSNFLALNKTKMPWASFVKSVGAYSAQLSMLSSS